MFIWFCTKKDLINDIKNVKNKNGIKVDSINPRIFPAKIWILFWGGTWKNTVSTSFLIEISTKSFVIRGVIVVTEYKSLSVEITLFKLLEKYIFETEWSSIFLLKICMEFQMILVFLKYHNYILNY